MSDNIFKEIDEQYRQEQLLRYWHRNASKLITILLVAIAAAIGAGYWQTERVHKKETETYSLVQALTSANAEGIDPKAAHTILAEAAAHVTGDRLIADTLAAASAASLAGDNAGAIREYDSVAQNSEARDPERKLADLSSVALQLDTGDPAALSIRLGKLSEDDSAWRFSAREFQALLALRTGDKKKAYDIASRLAKDKDAPDGVQTVSAQIAAISGEGRPPAEPDSLSLPPTK